MCALLCGGRSNEMAWHVVIQQENLIQVQNMTMLENVHKQDPFWPYPYTIGNPCARRTSPIPQTEVLTAMASYSFIPTTRFPCKTNKADLVKITTIQIIRSI